MATERIDLAGLGLAFGEASSVEGTVAVDDVVLGGQGYRVEPPEIPFRLDVSRTSTGYAVRLRFDTVIAGPCFRCLEPASVEVPVDAREVDQPESAFRDPGEGPTGEGKEAGSPYVDSAAVLDLAGWSRDALILALPERILCSPDCPGLCPYCGKGLAGADPEEHRHGEGGDPRWEKLRELG